MTLLWIIVKFINGCVLTLLLAQSVIYLWQLVVAFLELRQHRRRASRADPWWMLTSGVALPISILVPAYNEEETIVENVRSMLALHYPDFEVIVVNDGSKDRTLNSRTRRGRAAASRAISPGPLPAQGSSRACAAPPSRIAPPVRPYARPVRPSASHPRRRHSRA